MYKGIWSPFIEEEMLCEVEPDNIHDKYAIKVLKDNTVVGHVPRELSRYCCLILNSGGQMESVVTGARENKRGNGLEIPCRYKMKGPARILTKVEPIINDLISRK